MPCTRWITITNQREKPKPKIDCPVQRQAHSKPEQIFSTHISLTYSWLMAMTFHGYDIRQMFLNPTYSNFLIEGYLSPHIEYYSIASVIELCPVLCVQVLHKHCPYLMGPIGSLRDFVSPETDTKVSDPTHTHTYTPHQGQHCLEPMLLFQAATKRSNKIVSCFIHNVFVLIPLTFYLLFWLLSFQQTYSYFVYKINCWLDIDH